MKNLCTELESSPYLPKLEKAHAQQRRPSAVKKILIKKKKLENQSHRENGYMPESSIFFNFLKNN